MPTQMGNTAAPLTSLRMTMGMLVTGSIISPRIFISTSIWPPHNHRTVRPTQVVGAYSVVERLCVVAAPDRPSDPAARRRLRSWRILEGEDLIVTDAVEQGESVLEVFLSLTAKTNDHICRDANSTPRVLDAIDFFEVFITRISPQHPGQNARGP